MDELLEVLRTSLLFLFEGNRYRLAGSRVFPRPGHALIRIDSSDLSWLLTRENGQVSIVLRWREDLSIPFSTDILFQLVEGRVLETSLLTAEMAAWLRDNLDEIERRFRDDPDATRARLHHLMQQRARRLFGPAPWRPELDQDT